ncbi:IS30 family transposase [Paraburkholderia sp. GAS333]
MPLSQAPSTICREIKCNSGPDGYRASHANQFAWNRAQRPKASNWLCTERWRTSWQTSSSCSGHRSRLPDGSGLRTQTTRSTTCPTRPSIAVSSSSPENGLLEHLRRTRGTCRSRHHTQKTDDHGRIRDTVSISERPAAIDNRTAPGHWEGDLLCGRGSSQTATLVERQTRYVMLVNIASKDSETVIERSSNMPKITAGGL